MGFHDWYPDQAEFDTLHGKDDFWDDFAERLAKDAHQNYFPTRFGVWFLEAFDKVVLFNNNPYRLDVFQRDLDLAKIRSLLEKERMPEMGFGLWPSLEEASSPSTQRKASRF